MPAITHYSLNESLEIVEHGVVTKDQALKILDECSARQSGQMGSGEEAVAASVLGFSFDEKTFIEIAFETESKFRVKLEFPHSKRFLFVSLPSIYQKEIHVAGLPRLRDLVAQLFTLSLDDFRTSFESQKGKR
jgi:hypothetical protein